MKELPFHCIYHLSLVGFIELPSCVCVKKQGEWKRPISKLFVVFVNLYNDFIYLLSFK